MGFWHGGVTLFHFNTSPPERCQDWARGRNLQEGTKRELSFLWATDKTKKTHSPVTFFFFFASAEMRCRFHFHRQEMMSRGDDSGLLSCRNIKTGKQANRLGVNKQRRALPSAGPLRDREVSQHRSNDSLSDNSRVQCTKKLNKKQHTHTHKNTPQDRPFSFTYEAKKFNQFGASEIFTLPRCIFTSPQGRVPNGLKKKKICHSSAENGFWVKVE